MEERAVRQPVIDRSEIPPDAINVEWRHDLRLLLEKRSKRGIREEEAPDLLVIVYMIGGTALAFVSAVLGWRVATRTPSAPPGESVPDRSTTQWWSH